MGVDAGSTTLKAAVVNRAGEIVYSRYLPNNGNPVPLVRDTTIACHRWPFSQRHQTFFRDPGKSCAGVRGRFSWSHCRARSGYSAAKSFSPGRSTRLAQWGQPAPLTLDFTAACHWCPFPHCHHTFWWLPKETL